MVAVSRLEAARAFLFATRLAVRQKGADLEGFIDGALVGTFKLNVVPSPGPVGIGFKSASGKAAKVKLRDFTVTEL